ncbi:MAG: CbtB-domain containing protein [Rhodospirillaceae bacterium]|nr:CbtB-domain containing protein [Rhodospirillaceae bacterium]
MPNANLAIPDHQAAEQATASLPAILAIIFGVFMIFGTGFAQPTTMHNAAHDARHSFTFPCH